MLATTGAIDHHNGTPVLKSVHELYCVFRQEGFLDQFDVISFDVFDTLLYRRCSPNVILQNIFQTLEKRLQKDSLAIKIPVGKARDLAYKKLAARNLAAGLDFEVGLEKLVPEWLRLVTGGCQQLQDIITFLRETELDFEKRSIYPNKPFKEILEFCHRQEKRLVFTSDMYLGSDIVWNILGEMGLGNFDAGYVSGDHCLLKRTGRLYELLCQREGVAPEKILHIGDDSHADGTMAALKNIRSLVLTVEEEKTRIEVLKKAGRGYANGKVLNPGQVASLFARNGYHCLPTPLTFGLQVLGPILGPFVHRLLERCREEGITRVYFMARDGFLLKKLFDQLAPLVFPPAEVPRSYYLCVSRLTSFLASVQDFNLREFRYCYANNSGRPSVRNLFAPFGFAVSFLQDCAQRVGIENIDTPLPGPRNNPEKLFAYSPFKKLLLDSDLNKGISTICSKQKTNFAGYLKSLDFFLPGDIALVDVGWSGQIQDNIYQAFRQKSNLPRLWGMYLGLRETAVFLENERCRYEGLITDLSNPDWCGSAALDFVQVFEATTRAPHGTVVGYEKNAAEGYIPRFKSDDEPSRKAEIQDEPLLSGFQKGVLKYAQAYRNFAEMSSLPAIAYLPYAKKMIVRMVRYPTELEADWFVNLFNVSDLGSNEVVRLGGDVTHGKKMPLRKKVNLLKKSLWKYGTARQTGLGMLCAGLAFYQGIRFNNRYHGVPVRKIFPSEHSPQQISQTETLCPDAFGDLLLDQCTEVLENHVKILQDFQPVSKVEDEYSLLGERIIFYLVQVARRLLLKPPFRSFL